MKMPWKHSAITLITLPLWLYGQGEDFEAFMREQQQQYDSYVAENQRQHEQFVEQFEREFAAFKKGIQSIWGEVKVPDNTRFVEYASDSASVAEVDYEKGQVTVEAVVKPDESELQAQQRLQQRVREIVQHRGSNKLIPVADPGKQEPVLDRPLLADQVHTSAGKPVSEANADSFAKKVAQKAQTRPVPASSDKAEKKLTVSFPLVPDHLHKRARPYLALVGKYAKQYQVDPRHILATIHSESHFNPMARSHCNATGLMQLVAKSGGLEACRYVYKKDRIPSPDELFDPEENIKLGAAYIHVLLTRYYGKLTDDSSRVYCSIAAYNTGAGNVAKAFVGTSHLSAARTKINAMNSRAVYAHMIKHLPYTETRDYLQKVARRMSLYQ